MRTARRVWLTLHLYLGLGLGALFALLGLTGSVLVFYLDVDAALNPRIRVAAPVPAAPAPEAVLRRLQALHPERHGPWRIEMPLAADAPLMARYSNPVETAGRGFAPLMLTLDPATLEATSQRFWGDYAVSWLYDLHYTLLLRQPGTTAVGIAGLAMLVSLLTGLWLWWPSRARLAAALRPVLRSGALRKTYDLHVLGGIYGLLVLAALAFTGSALALSEQTRWLVGGLSPLRAPLRPGAGLLADGAAAISLDEAARVARGRFPDAELRWVESPGAAGGPIVLRLWQPGEPGRRFPRTQVWVHPASGEILAVRNPRDNSGGDTFMAWLHPLHNGEALGLAGRWLACIAGLLPAMLLVTGWLRWRHKRRARRATAERRGGGR